MTYNPPTLQSLGNYWNDQGGANLGVVGDTAHAAKGYSYHLGADQLTTDAYSRRTARDVAGLTNAASAIDLGKLDGSLANLRRFSVWLVAQARANASGTSDIREIIYSPDGATVLRWDRERGYASAPRSGEADDSHLTHTHVSWYRDAESRDHTTAFRPYFEGADVQTIVTINAYPARGFATKAGLTKLRRFNATGEATSIATPYSGSVDGDVTVSQSDGRIPRGSGFLRLASGGSAGFYILAAEVDLAPLPAPVDCTALVAAEHERVRTAAIKAAEAL